ncbi:MAG: phospholipid carrier-dependent glycosyltransferase [Clostridia bacterium]|nr:phospholipid carrier-dependent glycosyltransferase [Clostridia bacterium]
MKQMNRRVLLAAALIVIALAACAAFLLPGRDELPLQEGNLIENGDFSAVSGGMPDGWRTGMWVTSAGASYLEAVTLEDGAPALLVENAALNDARFEQAVSVRPEATYRLTARVRAEGCDTTRIGANVSFLGIYGTSDCVYDTDGEFETVTLYARTGRGQTEATVCLRLGGYGSENTGKAWFRDAELVQVEEAPLGVTVLDIAPPEPSAQSGAPEDKEGLSRRAMIALLAGVAALYAAFAAACAALLLRPREGDDLRHKGSPMALAGVLVAAALVRVVLAAMIPGYGVDMGCYGAWAGKMASGGPMNFYSDNYFCDYPPVYMLVLGVVGWLANALGVNLGSMDGQFLLKLTPILCDLALAGAVYGVGRRSMTARAALGLAALTAFNPAFIVTGSCWGQVDSVLAILLVLMLLPARRGRWHLAIPAFALAVLTKPQAGLLVPLGIAALCKDLFGRARDAQDKRLARRQTLIGIAGGLLLTVLISQLFRGNQPAFWLVEDYINTLSSYDYATLSTGNLMFLLGGNWVANSEKLFGFLTYGEFGFAMMALAFALGVWVYLRSRGRGRLFTSAALTMQLVFALGTKMHERYILPALALLVFAYMETGDVRILLSCVLASAASAVNIGAVLAFEYLIAPNMWLGYIISAVQLIAAALTLWTAASLALGRAPMRLPIREDDTDDDEPGGDDPSSDGVYTAPERRMREELLAPRDHRLHLRRRDYAIMLAITAVYAVVGFWNLGATDAPQTGYASSAPGETVTLDLGELREDFRIYYYGGISDTQFSFAASDDGVTFSEETDAFFDRGECFKWMAVRNPSYDEDGRVKGASGGMLSFSGRYLRVTFKNAGANLWEIAAVTKEGEVLPVVGAAASGAREGRGADPLLLIDEQNTVPDVPSWHNSMYFDEIYHGRTGYEHANALSTYETTHPPLGKVFMSWCIRLMGMTPFAWRFAGALCGVLMIPAMYLLAMTLLSSTKWAALSTLLLAADCMHYTQTRIATIDSFPVLFMMLMFMFMARWMKMNYYHCRLRDTFVPLALSGACMGLAIASKWIGCYGAVGLAALFFARFYNLCRQGLYARAHRDEDPAFERAANLMMPHAVKTIAACCVFFVLIPVAIYIASYIPYLRYYGEVKLNAALFRRVWDAQVLMFDYHWDLVAEHYFASPWYEWPLIVKPMWYYAADFKGAGMASSILAFGNPAVWWTGLAGILFVLGYSLYRNAMPAMGLLRGREDEYDRAMPVIAVGFLSAYLPWVLVSRLTFIYHYFASVPFIILATAQALRYMERRERRTAYILGIVLGAAAVALFVAFYPLASGLEVPRAWCDAVSWFDNWMWY